jgi:hypothetical protein
MIQKDLLNIFLEGTGIETDTADTVILGHLLPQFSPAGVDAVMQKYTAYIEGLLQILPKNSTERLELHIRRGFTFSEWQALFDATIRESRFEIYPVFRCLWIATERERRRVTFTLSKDSYDDYIKTLLKALSPFPSSLVNFFFGGCCYGKSIGKKTCA